ncbi:uncharacterized protein LOC127849713 [Dreissena polymorpha]|uniref:Uncharacterized protein n=1 Tax=Dreissena polymorpha TaxID=45954 RepID=A0A9D4HWZ1_DREPO|nr:uncharacterized protein LOC127849713 [Dreissena polymorpha]KAH3735892.1 hypothetical protein DPMN_042453 [Dreissena polymorpha]
MGKKSSKSARGARGSAYLSSGQGAKGTTASSSSQGAKLTTYQTSSSQATNAVLSASSIQGANAASSASSSQGAKATTSTSSSYGAKGTKASSSDREAVETTDSSSYQRANGATASSSDSGAEKISTASNSYGRARGTPQLQNTEMADIEIEDRVADVTREAANELRAQLNAIMTNLELFEINTKSSIDSGSLDTLNELNLGALKIMRDLESVGMEEKEAIVSVAEDVRRELEAKMIKMKEVSERERMEAMHDIYSATKSGVHELHATVVALMDQLKSITEKTITHTITVDEREYVKARDVQPIKKTSVQSHPATLELLMSADLSSVERDEKEPYLTGMDFLSDGRLVAVDNKNCKCIVLNEQLNVLGTPYTFKAFPRDVASLTENEIAVTVANSYIYFLSVTTGSDLTLIKTIKTSFNVFSICRWTSASIVVGTYEDPRPARIVSKDEEETEFEKIGFHRYKLGDSKSTFVTDSKTLVFTDRFDHSVYLYDTSHGGFIKVQDENIQQPRCVCAGPGDTVFVCSRNTNSIVQMNVFGEILGNVQLDIKHPYSVAMSKDASKLAVSNSFDGARKLKVYRLS